MSVLLVLFERSAYAQSTQKFGDGAISVRLCPATCAAVNGHGFKPGATVKVLESKSGWSRISGYLDRAKLVGTFGANITAKPALWVPNSAFANAAATTAPAKKTASKPKKVSVIDRLARLKKAPVPTFRPGSPGPVASAETATTNPEPAPKPVEVVETTTEVKQTPKVEEPKTEVVDSKPLVAASKRADSKASLTWEQVQARIAAQKQRIEELKNQSEEEKRALEERRAREAEAKRRADEAARKAQEARAAELARLNQKLAKLDELKAAKVEAQRLKEAQEAEEKRKVEQAAREAELAKIEAEKQQKAAEEAAKLAEQEAARVAEQEAAAKKAAEAAKASQDGAAKSTETKTVELPKVVERVVRKDEQKQTQVAINTTGTEEPKKEAPEPVFTSAEADPIEFGKRPKKLTKALLDKRLRKLPGRKSRYKREVVIAMRHYALGLLKSGECKGIAKAGVSAVPGMLYVACSDDPDYLRQFPLEEVSW